MILAFLVVFIFSSQTLSYEQNVKINVDNDGTFQLYSETSGEIKLQGSFNFEETSSLTYEKCLDGEGICLKDKENVKAQIRQTSEYCNEFEMTKTGVLCFKYENAQWFGGPERYVQLWPVQKLDIKNEPYIAKETDRQAVLESYWISSKGASIYISESTPLFYDSNNLSPGSLCFYANDSDPYLPRKSVSLKGEMCAFDDALVAHQYGIKNYLGKASDYLDTRMTRYPIWSTWVRYKDAINETILLDFANEIVQNGFTNSQFEIDDRWETCYGSMEVDTQVFANLSSLTTQLKELGFRVTFWVHPFVNLECQPHFNNFLKEGRLVLNENGSPNTTWWRGNAGHVDFSNKTTSDWFVQRVKKTMADHGIDSIKLDAGETSFMPQLPLIKVSNDSLYPDDFVKTYVDMAKQFGEMIEVRVGRRTQDRSVFIRMIDKDSRWGLDNGLETLITTMLQMNIVGYSYVLPDMIGGNVYENDVATKELFIRWLQANVLMPALQFSITPWDYDNETVSISLDILNLREKYFPYLDAAIRYHVATGDPINPPIWYIDPTNEDALKCSDEYLLVDRLLIAPVVKDGARSRDIYLPDGLWEDVNRQGTELIQGPVVLRNYSVPLSEIPIFENWRSKKLTLDLIRVSKERLQ